jgi:thymidylate kinase
LRNHQGLPFNNAAKDVDIVVKPGKIGHAYRLLRKVFRNNNLEYYDEFKTGKMVCMHGISLTEKTGIHFDLIAGLSIKGYELEEFDEIYQHTKEYQGLTVLDDKYEAFWIYICKIFGQKKPVIKQEYINKVTNLIESDEEFFIAEISKKVSEKYVAYIKTILTLNRYELLFQQHKQINKRIKRKLWREKTVKTFCGNAQFLLEKICRIIFKYNKYSRTFCMIAPDGTGKSTVIEQIIDKINYYYVSESKCSLYHFRPTIVPNLSEIGQKKNEKGEAENVVEWEQMKPAGVISSFFRIAYYSMDYIVGWRKQIRRDVHFDKYSVFDRYSYDLLVDPRRTKLRLPYGIRRFFVALTPKPKIVFLLSATADTIYKRKQELPRQEIERQLREYQKLRNIYKNIYILDAEKNVDVLCDKAMKILFDCYLR